MHPAAPPETATTGVPYIAIVGGPTILHSVDVRGGNETLTAAIIGYMELTTAKSNRETIHECPLITINDGAHQLPTAKPLRLPTLRPRGSVLVRCPADSVADGQ